ncbi:MAG: dTDP-4-dehydrorhamnose reductase [Rickettsiaceae bacterium]|nr:dTDP-4-dehydrorhamnose reductase [Rickettsiaceae bacterium]
MQIIIIGKTGQVANALINNKPKGVGLTICGREEIDLSLDESMENFCKNCSKILKGSKKNVIINAAAYTNVAKAEEEEGLAMQVNAYAQARLARFAADNDILYVSYSTDYIFDGEKLGSYHEDDEPNPLNIYGKSKLAGEKMIHATNANYLILRTSWVFSDIGSNFVKKIYEMLHLKDTINVIDDQFGTPTSSKFISEKTYELINIVQNLPRINEIINIAQYPYVSWYEFAYKIKEILHLTTKVNKISSHEYGANVIRPKNSVLSTQKLENFTGQNTRIWAIDLEEVLNSLARQKELNKQSK